MIGLDGRDRYFDHVETRLESVLKHNVKVSKRTQDIVGEDK